MDVPLDDEDENSVRRLRGFRKRWACQDADTSVQEMFSADDFLEEEGRHVTTPFGENFSFPAPEPEFDLETELFEIVDSMKSTAEPLSVLDPECCEQDWKRLAMQSVTANSRISRPVLP